MLAIVTSENAGELGKATGTRRGFSAGRRSSTTTRRLPLVVAETFEQARAAAQLVEVSYERAPGAFDLAAAMSSARRPAKLIGGPSDSAVGDFADGVRVRTGASSTRRTRRRTSRTR